MAGGPERAALRPRATLFGWMNTKDTEATKGKFKYRFSFVSFVSFVLITASAYPNAQSKKPTSEQWDQIRPLFKLVEEVAAGSPAPSDIGLKWQCHFVNAEAGVVFVPFTVKIERGAFTSFP